MDVVKSPGTSTSMAKEDSFDELLRITKQNSIYAPSTVQALMYLVAATGRR
jgi:hypothetical protein